MRRESLGRRSAADGDSPAAKQRLFAGYETRPAFYDEMFEATGLPRAHCQELCEALDGMPPAEIAAMQELAERSFLREGITFAVYGEEGAQERIIPIDFLPRLLDAADWDLVERGLRQRLAALNRFLADVYGQARILADGVVPVDLVRGCPQYRVEMQGLEVPHGIYVALCGTDIVRTNDGFVVLEDNLRVPSGVSYMLANRRALKTSLRNLFRRHRVRGIEHVLETGCGVCQDYTHVLIAIARSWGIPSRYVSGYLHREGAPGEQTPAGASHAWAEFLLPDLGWIGIDPTNDTVADHRHVRVAVGRDYADAAPTRGAVFGGGESRLDVRVTVAEGDEVVPAPAPHAERPNLRDATPPPLAPRAGADQ